MVVDVFSSGITKKTTYYCILHNIQEKGGTSNYDMIRTKKALVSFFYSVVGLKWNLISFFTITLNLIMHQ